MNKNDWEILARHGVTPDNLSVGGGLDLSGTPITSLPDSLSVGGWLDLGYTKITALPDSLSVGGDLYLSGTPITSLPDNLSVGGWLDLKGTPITPLYEDSRGYRLDRAGDYYHAGCRRFTAQQALEHWGHCRYSNLTRGDAYCRAIEAEEQRRNGA